MSFIKETLSGLGTVYLGGLYYFSIVHIPTVVGNYSDLKKGSIPTIIKQIITWPVSMVHIVKNGNPALQLVRRDAQQKYECELKIVAVPKTEPEQTIVRETTK
jgi:hypothetical protein